MAGRTAFDVDLARTLIDRKRDDARRDAANPARSAGEFGYIDDAAIPLMADALNISRAETLGVISFYHDFRRSPIDGRVLKLCRAESCQAMGCEDLVSHLRVRHGIEVDGADEGSELHVKSVYCLGNCALSPAALLTANRSAASTAIASTRSSRAPKGKRNERAAYSFPRTLRRCRSARTLVADAILDEARRRGLDIAIVRTGSRGLFWLEPLVEVETAAGRVGYGPVAPDEAAELFEAGFLDGGPHPKALGRVEDIPYLARQQRLIFARCGQTDPLSLDDYRRHGGFRGLERALSLGPKATVEEVLASGLRGRGGAGFPTGIKWRTTAGVDVSSKIRRLQRRRRR